MTWDNSISTAVVDHLVSWQQLNCNIRTKKSITMLGQFIDYDPHITSVSRYFVVLVDITVSCRCHWKCVLHLLRRFLLIVVIVVYLCVEW